MEPPLIDSEINLHGQTAVVTGANTGIGLVTARELAAAGAHVVLACRNRVKAGQAMETIKQTCPKASLDFLELDLSRLDSIRAAALKLQSKTKQIDILVNNAGVAGYRGQTTDGFEYTFGVNHIGHFALTLSIVDLLKDGGRIINIASKAHYTASKLELKNMRQPTRHITGYSEYAASKLANVLFSARLAKELQKRCIDCFAVHPGVIASDIWRKVPFGIRHIIKLFMISNEEGARTTLYCATSPAIKGMTGLYWDRCKPKTPSRLAQDESLQNTLWDYSLKWTNS
jgi:NAD(P)-dependent dehydrogenase (short-subunit alcohol dehydrogenase family)